MEIYFEKKVMKLYITGSVGSGKSTLAEQISKITAVKCTHLDEIVHISSSKELYGNIRRSDNEIRNIFYSVITENDYIIEDTGRACFIDGMELADKIIVLDIPLTTRKYRIIKRWIKQVLGIEKCIYKPDIKMLNSMFRWLNNYELGNDGTKSRIKRFEYKVIYLNSQNEIDNYINSLK